MLKTYTIVVEADVDDTAKEVMITSDVPQLTHPQAHRILIVLYPNAQRIQVTLTQRQEGLQE